MKKFLAAIAVAVLVAFAAPAFAATNPFMDVPLNHWAYDAIGQLAASGILSGYPDGTYKGRQPTTRYEMASALARALALIDMTKASKQDVEMMRRLIVEFSDELDALGVRLDELDADMAQMEGVRGWKISGVLDVDVDADDHGDSALDEDVDINMSRARIYLEKTWDNGSFFHARLDTGATNWKRFMFEFPAFFETKITVGRFSWNFEEGYHWNTGGMLVTDESVTGAYFTDNDYDGLGITKTFAMGQFRMYASRGTQSHLSLEGTALDTLELGANLNLQFTEQIGLDLGAVYHHGDDATALVRVDTATDTIVGAEYFDNLFAYWAGLRFDFNENIGLRAIYYGQGMNGESYYDGTSSDWDRDNASAYALSVSIGQDLLKFTDLWLGYELVEGGFYTGQNNMFYRTDYNPLPLAYDNDMSSFRIGARQRWNDQWSTWLYAGIHNFDATDVDGTQWGLGVEYQYNQHVGFGLSYLRTDLENDYTITADESLIRFRTRVIF